MISGRVKPKFLWFRISIGLGVLLAMLLLVQTLATYYFVSRSLVRQEAARDANRRVQSITRLARQAGVVEPAKLTPILNELVREDSDQIAWIRILNFDGSVVATSTVAAPAPAYKVGDLGKLIEDRDRMPVEVAASGGRVVVILNPVRLGGPGFGRGRGDGPPTQQPPQPNGEPGRGRGRRGPEVAEIGIYLKGVSTKFGQLQTNLIVGCAAAIALLGAILIIAVRFRSYMHGRHIEEELSVARRVQHDLFPDDASIYDRLGFAARCVPAYQVGGDLYDVFETDDGEIALVLGDVSGKGLPASLLMGVVQGAIHTSVGGGAASSHEQAAERLNHLLCMKTARERFVSLFWCYYDRDHGILRYVNAGHLPPLLMRQGPDGTQIIRLDEGGPVLGLLPGAHYRQVSVACEPGDTLVIFSDGIVEAANAADEEFGESGIAASIQRNWNLSPRDLCDAILQDARTFSGARPPDDDQTLLVVKLDPVATAGETKAQSVALSQ